MARTSVTLSALLWIASTGVVAQTPRPDAHAAGPDRLGWTLPEEAFEPAIADNLVNTEFLTASRARSSFPANTMMGFSGKTCPQGWEQATAEDGSPLFYAFGLLVDEHGVPRTSFVRIPACVKR